MTDEELVRRLVEGDTGAFDQLYGRYSRRLLHYCQGMLGHSGVRAQDLLQEIFLRLVEKGASFKRGARFSTWVFTVAHNLCCNELRHRQVRRSTIVVDMDALPAVAGDDYCAVEKALDQRAFKEALWQQLDQLDQERRSVFLLRYQEEFTLQEISAVLECPVGTVKSRLFYTIRYLAGQLQAFDPRGRQEESYEAN